MMTLNNNIPYKRPVLKSSPVFVNTRGVLQQLDRKHGGLYSTKYDPIKEDLVVTKPKRANPFAITFANTT